MTKLAAIRAVCDKSGIGPRNKLAMISGIIDDEPEDVSKKTLEALFRTAELFKEGLDHFEKEMAKT